MDVGFEELKKEIELELGRPIDQNEEITIKGLYYFGKGVKLRNQFESEPQRIGEILPEVMKNIEARMQQNVRMCQNGCGRPAIKSRPVCAECHKKDMWVNYWQHKAEHREWRKRFAKQMENRK